MQEIISRHLRYDVSKEARAQGRLRHGFFLVDTIVRYTLSSLLVVIPDVFNVATFKRLLFGTESHLLWVSRMH